MLLKDMTLSVVEYLRGSVTLLTQFEASRTCFMTARPPRKKTSITDYIIKYQLLISKRVCAGIVCEQHIISKTICDSLLTVERGM